MYVIYQGEVTMYTEGSQSKLSNLSHFICISHVTLKISYIFPIGLPVYTENKKRKQINKRMMRKVSNYISQKQLGSHKRVLNEVQTYTAIKHNDCWHGNDVLMIDHCPFIQSFRSLNFDLLTNRGVAKILMETSSLVAIDLWRHGDHVTSL